VRGVAENLRQIGLLPTIPRPLPLRATRFDSHSVTTSFEICVSGAHLAVPCNSAIPVSASPIVSYTTGPGLEQSRMVRPPARYDPVFGECPSLVPDLPFDRGPARGSSYYPRVTAEGGFGYSSAKLSRCHALERSWLAASRADRGEAPTYNPYKTPVERSLPDGGPIFPPGLGTLPGPAEVLQEDSESRGQTPLRPGRAGTSKSTSAPFRLGQFRPLGGGPPRAGTRRVTFGDQ
jgi:hypothetical protein